MRSRLIGGAMGVMPQTIAKPAVSWGPGVVAVAVHAATTPHPVPLHQMQNADGARAALDFPSGKVELLLSR
jgi:hypothetical protein